MRAVKLALLINLTDFHLLVYNKRKTVNYLIHNNIRTNLELPVIKLFI